VVVSKGAAIFILYPEKHMTAWLLGGKGVQKRSETPYGL
jgi:hypothetical protein